MDRMKNKVFTINEIKSGNIIERVIFLAITNSVTGIELDDSLINNNFYARFIPIFISKFAPVFNLRKRYQAMFQSTEKCQRVLEKMKSE